MKHCKTCNKEKDASEFYVSNLYKDGLLYRCKECYLSYYREQYRNNPVIRERALRWNTENPKKRKEVLRKSALKYREHNRKRGIEYQKRKRIEDPERFAIYNRYAAKKRRARLKNAYSNLSFNSLQKVLKSSNGICLYCGKPAMNINIDHVIPLSKNGKNIKSNLLPCCKSCNSSKGVKELSEWLYESHGIEGLARVVMYMEGKDFSVFAK